MKCETVTVVRKDHPAGKVDINKSDMTKDDVIFTANKEPEKKTENKPEKKSKK